MADVTVFNASRHPVSLPDGGTVAPDETATVDRDHPEVQAALEAGLLVEAPAPSSGRKTKGDAE